MQFERCREFCRHAGIAAFAHHDYEADDIVGTLVARCRAQGLPATLVTRDKDYAQLIRSGDIYWDYTDNARYHYEHIEERFGVAPERFADFLALMGDSVDNIKGVPGVGARPPRRHEGIRVSRRAVRQPRPGGEGTGARRQQTGRQAGRAPRDRLFARRLTEIACNMPMEVAHTDLVRRAPDMLALSDFFDQHNVGPMLRRQAERLALMPLAAAA